MKQKPRLQAKREGTWGPTKHFVARVGDMEVSNWDRGPLEVSGCR